MATNVGPVLPMVKIYGHILCHFCSNFSYIIGSRDSHCLANESSKRSTKVSRTFGLATQPIRWTCSLHVLQVLPVRLFQNLCYCKRDHWLYIIFAWAVFNRNCPIFSFNSHKQNVMPDVRSHALSGMQDRMRN